MRLEMSVSKILAMVLQKYQNVIEMTSNMICIVALGVGLKCPRKIHLNTQWGGGIGYPQFFTLIGAKPSYLHDLLLVMSPL